MLKREVGPEFATRRKRLMDLDPEACFVFFGANERVRNHDTHFSFAQESTFRFLTGLDEPGAVLVLVHSKAYLYVLSKNEAHEIWTGERYGTENAKSVFQVDEARPVESFFENFTPLLRDCNKVYYRLGEDFDRDRSIIKALNEAVSFQGKGRFGKLPLHDPMPLVSELRVIKDEQELLLLRKATQGSVKAHLHILKRARAGMSEFDAFNEFQYALFKQGCTEQGYTPIFAAGYNATTLHYIKNNDLLKHGDLLLIDAGGEVEGYTADITQTFPVSGKFSDVQKQIYQKVLAVNREITRMTKPGVSCRELHTRSVHMLTESLLSLGVLSGSLTENLESTEYRKYYPHGLTHYLGLDVHDVGIYQERGRDFLLQPGMCLTNEPGLYFRERGNPFYGIGIRIEDDLLVTVDGCENLTAGLPREIDEIENLRMASGN